VEEENRRAWFPREPEVVGHLGSIGRRKGATPQARARIDSRIFPMKRVDTLAPRFGARLRRPEADAESIGARNARPETHRPAMLRPILSPSTRKTRQSTRKITNRNLAIAKEAPAMPPKPRTAATSPDQEKDGNAQHYVHR